MGFYDLYGRAYATRREAMNAEDAQCGAIDADLAHQKCNELERRIEQLQQPTQIEDYLNHLESRIKSLEERLSKFESKTPSHV